MNHYSMGNLFTLLGFLAVFAIMVVARRVKHDKAKDGTDHIIRTNGVLILFAAAAITFTATLWFSGLFRATDHGFGMVMLAVPFGYGLVDSVLHIARNHPDKHKVKTQLAAACLGVSSVLIALNVMPIGHNLKQDVHMSNFAQVVDSVHPNGR